MVFNEFFVRLLTAMLLGTVIGAERQWRHKIAGLRTNALVAVGASMFVLFSTMVPEEASPTRMAAQVVSGIGFLGAGVIIRDGLNIRGLNTAATLWCSAAVGVLAGAGYPLEAAVGTCITVLANILIRYLQQYVGRRGLPQEGLEFTYRLRLVCGREEESHIRSLLLHSLNSGPIALISLSSESLADTEKTEVYADILAASGSRSYLEQIVRRMSLEKTVSAISWSILETEA